MPDRLTLLRVKGYRKPPQAVSVVRPTVWGNPWVVGDPGILIVPPHMGAACQRLKKGSPITQIDAVSSFRFWLNHGFSANPASPCFEGMSLGDLTSIDHAFAARRALVLSRLPELRGRDLCCRCKPGYPCHADVLLEMANA